MKINLLLDFYSKIILSEGGDNYIEFCGFPVFDATPWLGIFSWFTVYIGFSFNYRFNPIIKELSVYCSFLSGLVILLRYKKFSEFK